MSEYLVEEGKFRYLERGKGRVIIVLHGLMGNLSNFEGVLNQLSKSHHVIIPELPIYELKVLKTNVKSLGLFVKDFLVYKGVDKAVLLGNSLGGHVALYVAKHFPALVEGMVLTGSSGLYENSMGDSYPKRGDKDYIRKKTQSVFYDPNTVTDEMVDMLYELFKNRNNVIRIVMLAKSAIRNNMAKDLPHIHIPTCLIWGKQDEVTPPKVAEEFNELLPLSELHWIDLCGHAPMMEHPNQFNQIVERWLADQFPNS